MSDGAGGGDPMRRVVERVGRITEENRRLFEELIAGERRYRSLAKAVWQVQEEERRRLARELHDGIGQVLTALKNRLQRMVGGVSSAEDADRELAAGLGEALSMASQALAETRELSRLLRPPVLDDLGLEAALHWLARTVAERDELEVEVRVVGLDGRLPRALETLVFRVTQEALTNAVKHSGAERASVELRRERSRLRLVVSDDGAGFDAEEILAESSTGLGLRGIRDRVELFAGAFHLDSAADGGTRLEVELDVGAGEEER